MGSSAAAWRARTFASLSNRDYRRYFIGLLFSMSGFWMRIAATGWFVWELTESYESLGIVTAAGLLPWVPVAPLAGVLAEHVDHRRMLIWVYAGVGLLNAVLGLGMLHDAVGWTEILVVTILVACLRGMEHPARHALVRDIVGRKTLANAVGLNATAFHLSHATGFALAGGVLAFGGPGACFLVVAATVVPLIVQLTRLDLEPQVASTRRARPCHELLEGFAYVWRHRLTRGLVCGSASMILLLFSYRALMPGIARQELHLGPGGYGMLMSLGGTGALLGALWVASGSGGRRHRLRNQFVLVWIACAAIATLAWAQTVWVCAAALPLAGFCQVGFMATANATVQETVPDALRARVMGIWALMFGAAFPVGNLLLGWLAQTLDRSRAISSGVVVALALSTGLVLFLRRRLGGRAAIGTVTVPAGDASLGVEGSLPG